MYTSLVYINKLMLDYAAILSWCLNQQVRAPCTVRTMYAYRTLFIHAVCSVLYDMYRYMYINTLFFVPRNEGVPLHVCVLCSTSALHTRSTCFFVTFVLIFAVSRPTRDAVNVHCARVRPNSVGPNGFPPLQIEVPKTCTARRHTHKARGGSLPCFATNCCIGQNPRRAIYQLFDVVMSSPFSAGLLEWCMGVPTCSFFFIAVNTTQLNIDLAKIYGTVYESLFECRLTFT